MKTLLVIKNDDGRIVTEYMSQKQFDDFENITDMAHLSEEVIAGKDLNISMPTHTFVAIELHPQYELV